MHVRSVRFRGRGRFFRRCGTSGPNRLLSETMPECCAYSITEAVSLSAPSPVCGSTLGEK